MERLTKRITENQIELSAKANTPQHYSPIIHIKHPFWTIFDKLAEYEQAEEDGLLIRLPCKVGDKVWVIDDDFKQSKNKKIYEAKWKRVTLVQVSEKPSFEIRGEVSYQVYDFYYNDGRTMPHGMFVGQHNTKIGEAVFLTKAEAEQALAKMKGE